MFGVVDDYALQIVRVRRKWTSTTPYVGKHKVRNATRSNRYNATTMVDRQPRRQGAALHPVAIAQRLLLESRIRNGQTT